MDPYAHFLEKLRLPQPSLQKQAVISLFSALRSSSHSLTSAPARAAISHCLSRSSSPAVIDQAVRELCRLVLDSKLDISTVLVELQSGLEGSDPVVVDVFVKGIGFVVRVGFKGKMGKWEFVSVESHPFVKVLSSRAEVQNELKRQVLLFMLQSKHLGMVKVCEFLRPFLKFSIIRIPFSGPSSSSFLRGLVSSVASFCCSHPFEAMPVLKLLTSGFKYLPLKDVEDLKNFIYIVECVVDTYIVVLRCLAEKKSMLIVEAQLYGVELLQSILCPLTNLGKQCVGSEPVIECLGRMLVVQKDLGLKYVPDLSSVVLSLFVNLVQSELEHEQLSITKVLLSLLRWKYNDECEGGASCGLSEEHLLVFPVISLLSSPSRSVKRAAADLLHLLEELLLKLRTAPKGEMVKDRTFPTVCRPEAMIFRCLQHLWFEDQLTLPTSFFLSSASSSRNETRAMHKASNIWASCLKEYCTSIVERRKSIQPLSRPQENFITKMSLPLSCIACVLLMHQSLEDTAVDILASIGFTDPKLGVPLLLTVLFYNNIFTKVDIVNCSILPKLLGVLPRIASHPMMIPFVVQTLVPMLSKDSKSVLYATAVRLLSQTWEMNSRTFENLQGVLLPNAFLDFASDRDISIGLAASVRDVCRKNPDRGVDLILSVSACIESRDKIIQALGFQSLAHLCEADVIDFYTAWDVIAKHVMDYFSEPILAQSICFFLKWGAMDAEAYEAASNVLKIVWDVGAFTQGNGRLQWANARVSALEALTNYEVSTIERTIPDFKIKITELLFSETNPNVLMAMENFLNKIIAYEYLNRRRLVKEKRAAVSRIEKLLDVFPQVIFSSGKRTAGELPGAALLTLSFNPNIVNPRPSRGLQGVHVGYENAMVEISTSLQLCRNIYIGLISLQSWKSFMRRWLRAYLFSIDAKGPPTVLDKTSRAASEILKSMIQIAGESLPRSAENIALAIGALCGAIPPSVHAVKSTASKFLLGWLYLYEHEHCQWSAAVSLGLISSSLHITDHIQKFQNINGLLEVFCTTKSTFVRGACGIGLGLSCQDLLTRSEPSNDAFLDKESNNIQELRLLGKIVSVLSHTLCQLSSSTGALYDIIATFFLRICDINVFKTSELVPCHDFREDIWGIAGIVHGLGNSIGALYRAEAHDAVLEIKRLILSWIPHINPQYKDINGCSDTVELALAVGSCLALPGLVEFCQRVELVDDNELEEMVDGYMALISELLSVKKTGTLHQNLLMAACVGVGSLLSCILNEGVHPLKVVRVKEVMNILKRCYSVAHPPIVHFSGMLGIVNAMGADAGLLFHGHHMSPNMQKAFDQQESSYIMGPLLSASVCEPHMTSLMQEIYLLAQNSNDLRLQEYAAWAVSFLRHSLWSKENADSNIHVEDDTSKIIPQSFSNDSVVMKLCLWLMHLNHYTTGDSANIETVATVLRCLSRAPRLPALEWGSIIRRCMKFGAQDVHSLSISSKGKETLREDCVRLSLAHANQYDTFLTFLDELVDLPRFRTLELSLQSCLLSHLADLVKIFSGSRLEKLLNDIANYLSSLVSYQAYNPSQKSLLRISSWKGLYQCLVEASLDSLDYICSVEECVGVLFSLLPPLPRPASVGPGQLNYFEEEWSEAVKCLGKARQVWLLNCLQVSEKDFTKGNLHLAEVLKRILAKVKLIRIGFLPLTELARLKAYILNCEIVGIWDVLVEVVAVLQHAEEGVIRQWLADGIEITCVTTYPSTALQFVALLSGSCCKYMPLLVLDKFSVLSNLPVTLHSLLSDPSWQFDIESFISHLWASMERIHSWAMHVKDGADTIEIQNIDVSENPVASFLASILRQTCIALKDSLPLDKQLRLSAMADR